MVPAMNLPDFLTQDDAGSIRLSGHRIDLAHLLGLYIDGYSPEMLWSEYPQLTLALIHKTIGYYLDNQQMADGYLARFRDENAHRRAHAVPGPDLKELRNRLDSMRAAQGA